MPPIDITRFHQTFFDESFEGLDVMESGLLRLDPDAPDDETINAIFRAAHSIKGGAGTFGFATVAEFTHLLETLLDQMRSGNRPVTCKDVDVLLRSVDVLRSLLTAARDGSEADTATAQMVSEELGALLAAPAATVEAPAPAQADAPVAAAPRGWRIEFIPKPELFASGNDPLRIIRELTLLGRAEVICDTDALPMLTEAMPEACYLSWRIDLHADCGQDAIADVFAWVEDECDLSIEPLAVDDAEPAADTVAVTETLPDGGEQAPGADVDTPSTPPAQDPPAAASGKPELTVIKGGRPAVAASRPATSAERSGEGGSIRVSTEKIDALINLVGELVITQAMLQQTAQHLDPVTHEELFNGLNQLNRNTRVLQEAVMSTRMLPVEFVFSRFPRVVRDLASKLGKQVQLQTVGEKTELDKSVIERIADPLTHLVRNSLDHGIESPERRTAAGKPATGTIRLSASHQGGHIVIEVSDDGAGLDRERILSKARERGIATSDGMADEDVWQLIFEPGFSTAEQITDVSGRGVGMDVVKRNIEALSGSIEISSESGRGSRILIRLPLTLAILDGMSVRIGGEIFIVPLNNVIESLQPQAEQLKSLVNQAQVIRLRAEYVPLVRLQELFGVHDAVRDPQQGIVVVLESGGRKIAALVDELVGQQQVVIKSLESNYRRVPCVSGATILGNGQVALIIDAAEIVRQGARANAA